MKKIFLMSALFIFFTTTAFAFLYDLEILPKEKIAKLSDENLIDYYTEAIIELEASRTFHGRAGFTPKEYKQHKDLLRYIIELRKAMEERQINPPNVSEYLQ